jgi:peptidoglycan/xylan/chitin deacetylase (PgdA/CDA1 family)
MGTNTARRTAVLLYHDICATADASMDNFAVTQMNFERQMECLFQDGIVGVSLGTLMGDPASPTIAQGTVIDSAGKVVLTFDDGAISHYRLVAPILRRMKFTATFFVTINEIGAPERMSWDMIEELAASGMDLGSHGMAHTFLTAQGDRALSDDLTMSRKILEEHTKKPANLLSVPRGFYDKRVVAIARDAGFKAVCTSDAGYNDLSGKDAFVLKRFAMRRGYSLDAFRSIVRGHPSTSIVVAERLRAGLRGILGYKAYDRLRSLRYGTARPAGK